MMQARQIKFALALGLGLLGLWLLLKTRTRSHEFKDERVDRAVLQPGKLENLSLIRIQNPKANLQISPDAQGIWRLDPREHASFYDWHHRQELRLRLDTGIPIAFKELQSFLHAFQIARCWRLIADKPEKRFGFPSQRIELMDKTGKHLLDLHLGARHPTIGHYARFGNSPKVYWVQTPKFSTELKSWISYTPLAGLSGEVAEIALAYGMRSALYIQRKSPEAPWSITRPFLAHPKTRSVESLLKQISGLTYLHFLDLKKPSIQKTLNASRYYQLRTFSGEVYILRIGSYIQKTPKGNRTVHFLVLGLPEKHPWKTIADYQAFKLPAIAVEGLPYQPDDLLVEPSDPSPKPQAKPADASP